MSKPRPLSPHLQIYKPQMTSILSICHRATGVVLAAGTGLVCLWLVALALGEDSFALAQMIIQHPLVNLSYSAIQPFYFIMRQMASVI